MQIQDLLKVYQAKSDEELLQLAATPAQLTSQAQLALQGELSRRKISIPVDSGMVTRDGDRHDARQVTSSETSQAGERLHLTDFLAEVLRTYHRHFWLYFKITVPTVIVATIALFIARNEGREIARHLPPGFDFSTSWADIIEIWFVNFAAYLVTWIASSVCFAGICIATEEIAAGFTPSAWESVLNVRERVGSLIRLSLLLFVMALVIVAAYGVLLGGIFWLLRKLQLHLSHLQISIISYGIVLPAFLVFSRLGLATPALVLDDSRVGQAIFRSDELTQGKWLILATLVTKSLIGGYVGAMCPFWLASLVPVTSLPSWFPWILTCASIIGVTVAEPPFFVGLALLYLKMSPSGSTRTEVMTNQFA
jgi:hypothetical protein